MAPAGGTAGGLSGGGSALGRTLSRGRRALGALPHVGAAHRCPCCGWRLRHFLPFGIPPRPSAQCPRCGSLERHRLLWLFLNERTRFFHDPLRVLHFAPEPVLRQRFARLPNLTYTTADLQSPGAQVHMDIQAIQFPGATFDAILANHVLEHVPDDRKAMRELHRVLKPGGWAILQVPLNVHSATTDEDPTVTDPAERIRRFGQDDHVRYYGLDYKDRLEEAGFKVEVVPYAKQLGGAKAKRYGLDASEDVYYCRK